MKIGNIETKNNIFLAPMAGVTTPAFRTICLEKQAGLVYAEMVSDKGLCYENNKTLEMLDVWENEHPIAMQIFGSTVETMVKAAKMVDQNSKADIIDINMGCPVQKVVKAGSGSELLKDPNKIYDIVSAIVENVKKPVTVKIRLGWDHNSINCVEVAKLIEKAGAKAIAVHGRTRSDMYNGTSNLDYIKQVKEAVKIPIIGNGDIKDIESAKKMFEYTGCDAIMIGRAACGNPWLFSKLNAYFSKGIIIDNPTKEEIISLMLEHARRLVTLKGEYVALVEMRTHAAWYLKQLIGTKKYRVDVVSVKSLEELEKLSKIIINDINVYSK